MDEPNREPLSNPQSSREMNYKGRRVTIREGDARCEILIDDVPMHVARLAPDSYHSHILMFRDFPTAESLAQALVDTEGTLWLLPKPGDPGHPHGGHSH